MQPFYLKIDPSALPALSAAELERGLCKDSLSSKIHYLGSGQAAAWINLHRNLSPSQTDLEVRGHYQEAFSTAAAAVSGQKVHVISIGCGDGSKDVELLKCLKEQKCEVQYSPSDLSMPLLLTAVTKANCYLKQSAITPIIFDLETKPNWNELFDSQAQAGIENRIYLLLGVVTNTPARGVLRKFSACLDPADTGIISANMADAREYRANFPRIAQEYVNQATKDWLLKWLTDAGGSPDCGQLDYVVESAPEDSCKRIALDFHVRKKMSLCLGKKTFLLKPGRCLRLFYSNRFTRPGLMRLIQQSGLRSVQFWSDQKEREAVVMVKSRVL